MSGLRVSGHAQRVHRASAALAQLRHRQVPDVSHLQDVSAKSERTVRGGPENEIRTQLRQ